VKLDPKYNFPTGIITCKIFINDVYFYFVTLKNCFDIKLFN